MKKWVSFFSAGIVVGVFLALCASPCQGATDSNAAVRYLSAVGHLGTIPSEIKAELEAYTDETTASITLSASAAAFLESMDRAFYFLKLGAGFVDCSFTPDNGEGDNYEMPPCRSLESLAIAGIAKAWMLANQGKMEEGRVFLESVFQLGQHLDPQGLLVSRVTAQRIRVRAIKGMLLFCDLKADYRKPFSNYLQKFKRPLMHVKDQLRCDREFLQKMLLSAVEQPSLLLKFGLADQPAVLSLPSVFKLGEKSTPEQRLTALVADPIYASWSYELMDFFRSAESIEPTGPSAPQEFQRWVDVHHRSINPFIKTFSWNLPWVYDVQLELERTLEQILR